MAETQNLHITFGQLPEGFRGPQGPIGPIGPAGPQGPQGPKGDSIDNTKYPSVAHYLKRQNVYATEDLESILHAIIDNLGKPMPRVPSAFSFNQPSAGDTSVYVYGESHFFVMLSGQENTKTEIIGGAASLALPEPFGTETLVIDYLDMTGSRVETYRITPDINVTTVAKAYQYYNIYGVETLDLPKVTTVEENAITFSGYKTINLPECTSWIKGPLNCSSIEKINAPKLVLTSDMKWDGNSLYQGSVEFIVNGATDASVLQKSVPYAWKVYNEDKTKKFNYFKAIWETV